MDKEQQKVGGIVGWFINNHVASNLLMCFILITGAVAVLTLNREIFPTIDPKLINVSVVYPGATPEDIEESITRRVDDAVVGVQGVKRVESNAYEGLGTINIEINDFADSDQVLSDIETAVNAIQDFPPENAEKLKINKLKPVANVMKIIVYGNHDVVYLRKVAEQVKDQLKELSHVSLVDLYGTTNREISIEVSDSSLKKYGLSQQVLADIIRANSLDIPLGNLKTSSNEIALRVKEKNYYAHEFSEIIVKTLDNGTQIKLSDVAVIKDGLSGDLVYSRYNGQNSIGITVERDSSQDSIKITNQIKEFLKEIDLPHGVNLTVWKDESEILSDRINLLTRNAILGLALVFLALVLFMDLKLAFWTAVGIAVSFLGGIALAGSFGITINMISLFALIVVLGVVVDDAIIAGESIFSEQEAGKRDKEAVTDGVKKVITPVTIGVATTIAAFAPLIFSTGILGQILKPIPIVVISILVLSLVEAFLILPTHLQASSRWSRGKIAAISDRLAVKLANFVEKVIIPFAKLCIRFKYISLLSVLAFFVSSILLFKVGILKFVFFPNIEADELTVKLEMPVGSSIQQTENYLLEILEVGHGGRQKSFR